MSKVLLCQFMPVLPYVPELCPWSTVWFSIGETLVPHGTFDNARRPFELSYDLVQGVLRVLLARGAGKRPSMVAYAA